MGELELVSWEMDELELASSEKDACMELALEMVSWSMACGDEETWISLLALHLHSYLLHQLHLYKQNALH